ncbi:hypothetical protein NGF69_17215 [Enterococcus casseliflavus]|nr:hypothetical protein [Enterococcus casseliflavus]
MYTLAIAIGSIGVLLLIIQLVCFLKDYSIIVKKYRTRGYLLPNILGLVGSITLIGLGVTYFILVNNQL